jgi:hypothetical protein
MPIPRTTFFVLEGAASSGSSAHATPSRESPISAMMAFATSETSPYAERMPPAKRDAAKKKSPPAPILATPDARRRIERPVGLGGRRATLSHSLTRA